MIIGVARTGVPVDISNKLPVQPVKPIPAVFRSLEQPAATFERSNNAPPIQIAYGPPSKLPAT